MEYGVGGPGEAWGCPRRYWGQARTAPESFHAAIRAVTEAALWDPEHEQALSSMVARRDAVAIREWAAALVQGAPDLALERLDADEFFDRIRVVLHRLADQVAQQSGERIVRRRLRESNPHTPPQLGDEAGEPS